MAENASAEEMTRVDTGAMREVAASIESNLKAVKAAYSELVRIYTMISGNGFDAEGNSGFDSKGMWFGILEGKWMGSAADAYSQNLIVLLTKVVSAYQQYETLPSTIIGHAEDYERAHGIAVAAAQGIEAVTWAAP